jgi:hypothetical protein
MAAGRRRKSKKTRRTSRKMRGGNGYGAEFSGANSIGVGAMPWTANMTSTPNGQPIVGSVGGRRRKSKSRKASRRRRTMRGGMSVAGSGAAFTGEGAARGMGGFQGYSTGGPMDVVALPSV